MGGANIDLLLAASEVTQQRVAAADGPALALDVNLLSKTGFQKAGTSKHITSCPVPATNAALVGAALASVGMPIRLQEVNPKLFELKVVMGWVDLLRTGASGLGASPTPASTLSREHTQNSTPRTPTRLPQVAVIREDAQIKIAEVRGRRVRALVLCNHSGFRVYVGFRVLDIYKA